MTDTHYGTYSTVNATDPLDLIFLCGPKGDSRDCYAGITIILMSAFISAPIIVLTITCINRFRSPKFHQSPHCQPQRSGAEGQKQEASYEPSSESRGPPSCHCQDSDRDVEGQKQGDFRRFVGLPDYLIL